MAVTETTAPVTRRVLVTGVGRRIGIGAAVADALRIDGWDVVTCGLRAYDRRMPWGEDEAAIADLEADFADPHEPGRVIDAAGAGGALQGLVLCHCESVDSSIHDTSVESWDRHFAVNARSVWLLIKHFAERFASTLAERPTDGHGAATGRIVAFTSDHTAHNLPYGASKGALDRIVLAAAEELAPLGITANLINPGATDTGWMNDEVRAAVATRNLQPRVGLPRDSANLVRFLLGPDGGWINGQLLFSDGGLRRH
jgi:3-oxoacyl-[acyl-carrier protein] reductase